MAKTKKNKTREDRIAMEIVVDTYDEEEQAMGWYVYLEDKVQFPYKARVISQRRTSPLVKGETVQVKGLSPADECEHEMFVDVTWEKRTLAVPLSQLKPLAVDLETKQAVEDWHYWVAQGYEF